MKQVAILLTSLLIAFVTGCQDHNMEPNPEDVMAWRAGGPTRDEGQSIAVDNSGNVYVTGYFTGTATFGSTTLTSSGVSDIFIVKYNNRGDVLWAHRAGGPGTDPFLDADRGQAIVVDDQGNVFVTGFFSGTATFGTISPTSNGGQDLFISKYNSNGEVQWVKSAGGSSDDRGNGITIDKSGNLYVTGSFMGTATFGSTSLTSTDNSDVFIAKYNSNGDVLWAQQAGGGGADGGNDIAVDESGNAYITGYFQSTATFGTIAITRAGDHRARQQFIAKYGSTGEVLWAQRNGNFGNGIAVDRSGNVYVTGAVNIIVFNTEIYLTKLNTNGEPQWAIFIGRMGSDELGNDIALDKSGNIYLTGYTNGSQLGVAPFPLPQPGGGSGINLTHYGGADVFVGKFDNAGNFLWARSAGGTGSDSGEGIAVDESGTVYTTGYFNGTATFGTTTLTSSGESDVFVAKFKQ